MKTKSKSPKNQIQLTNQQIRDLAYNLYNSKQGIVFHVPDNAKIERDGGYAWVNCKLRVDLSKEVVDAYCD